MSLQSQQVHRGPHIHSVPLCSVPPGLGERRAAALCGLQLSIQHNHPSRLVTKLLDLGLPYSTCFPAASRLRTFFLDAPRGRRLAPISPWILRSNTNFRFLDVYRENDLEHQVYSCYQEGTAETVLPGGVRINHITQKLLISSVESILTHCLCVWFSSCTAADRKELQRVVTTAPKIPGCSVPSMEDLYSPCSLRNPSQPGHSLSELLPSSRCFRAVKTR